MNCDTAWLPKGEKHAMTRLYGADEPTGAEGVAIGKGHAIKLADIGYVWG